MDTPPQPNDGDKVTNRLYIWLASDLENGVEGPIIYPPNERGRPMVTTNRQQALALTEMMQGYATYFGVAVRLVQFDRGITLQVEEPKPRPSWKERS